MDSGVYSVRARNQERAEYLFDAAKQLLNFWCYENWKLAVELLWFSFQSELTLKDYKPTRQNFKRFKHTIKKMCKRKIFKR